MWQHYQKDCVSRQVHGAAVFFRHLSEVGQTVLTALGGWGHGSEWAAAARLLPAGAQHCAWAPACWVELRPGQPLFFQTVHLKGLLALAFLSFASSSFAGWGDGAGFGLTLGAKS